MVPKRSLRKTTERVGQGAHAHVCDSKSQPKEELEVPKVHLRTPLVVTFS